MKSWLEKNDIEMHLTHNEEISAIAERFIRTLKSLKGDKLYVKWKGYDSSFNR